MQLDGIYVGKKDRVVASRVRGNHGAIELREASLEQGRASLGKAEGHAQSARVLLGLARLRKVFSERLLMISQEIDAKLSSFENQGKRLRAMVHTDQHEQRLERNGSKRVRGHSMNRAVHGAMNEARHGAMDLAVYLFGCLSVSLAGVPQHREDGDAGGELSHGFAKFRFGQRHRGKTKYHKDGAARPLNFFARPGSEKGRLEGG